MLKILLTGGGTAGHVLPNIALIQHIQSMQAVSVLYVGSKTGIEKKLIEQANISYHSIITGKLRRSLSWRNLVMPLQLLTGVIQSYFICRRFKPTIVFSKGGFVALPVVMAAWLYKSPIFVHESDVVPGLANRISFPFAKRIFLAFDPRGKQHYAHKTEVTGLPIRKTLLKGNPLRGRSFLGFHEEKPILLIWGGSLGAASLNNSIAHLLPKLIQDFQIVHLCGVNKKVVQDRKIKGYQAFEYLNIDLLPDVLACADLVVSRAGATAIYELLMLKKPHILCPLSKAVSRGEQICNANYVAQFGLSAVIAPEAFNDAHLLATIKVCIQTLPEMKQKLESFSIHDGAQFIYEALLKLI